MDIKPNKTIQQIIEEDKKIESLIKTIINEKRGIPKRFGNPTTIAGL